MLLEQEWYCCILVATCDWLWLTDRGPYYKCERTGACLWGSTDWYEEECFAGHLRGLDDQLFSWGQILWSIEQRTTIHNSDTFPPMQIPLFVDRLLYEKTQFTQNSAVWTALPSPSVPEQVVATNKPKSSKGCNWLPFTVLAPLLWEKYDDDLCPSL